jgi:vancomycin permeability regulator SanA
MAGLGMAGLAAVVGSVRFVRARAAGHIYTEADVPAAPVALVLGAKVFPDGTPSPFLAARLDLAKRLYDAGRVEAIIVSGDSIAPEYDEPAAMREYLMNAGVPESKLIIDTAGFDTYESCVRATQVFKISRLIMVTQSYHLPRAVATCRALGVDAMGVGDDLARQHSRSWRRGVVRDQLACLKTVIDLRARPGPMPESTITAVETPLDKPTWERPSTLDQQTNSGAKETAPSAKGLQPKARQ